MYYKLISFLKRQKDNNYIPTKSKTLTTENVIQFFNDACDDTFLLMKVVLIFGLHGACRRAELYNLFISDIVDNGLFATVTLYCTNTKKNSIFTIISESNGYNLYKKYYSLRPSNVKHEKLFTYYNKGKCFSQPVGIQSFGKIPQQIAAFLKLPESHTYTGHCLRRTSATFLSGNGGDMQMLQMHGG